jgi:hypothetical protein
MKPGSSKQAMLIKDAEPNAKCTFDVDGIGLL